MRSLEKIIHSGKTLLAASLLSASLLLPYNSSAEPLRIAPNKAGYIEGQIPIKLSRSNMTGSYNEKKIQHFIFPEK